MWATRNVALLRALERREGLEDLWMCLRVSPVLGNPGPLGAKTLFIGVCVLDDDTANPFGMLHHNPKADRTAVILHVKEVAVDLELLEQRVGGLGEMVEGVAILSRRRRIALPKARIVGCNEVVAGREERDERIEHPRGRGKSVQQDDGRRILWPGFTIENADAIDLCALIGGCSRRGRQCRGECRGPDGHGCGSSEGD